MKKKLMVLCLIIIFPIIGIFAKFYLDYIVDVDTGSGNEKRVEQVNNYAKPDLEFLEYYGLDFFDTDLPVIFIDTKGQLITKENGIEASMAVLDNTNEGHFKNIEDMPDYKLPINLKYRGASSYSQFDKKQYRLKLMDKKDHKQEKNYPFLGMGKHSEWVLNGPFLDKTLLRNKLVYDIGKEIFEWAPDSRFLEVFIDGHYDGVYLAIEPITNGESRLRLGKFGLLSGETAYILKRDRVGTETNSINNYGTISGKTKNELYISYPSPSKITNSQKKWIENDISKFEKVLYSKDFDDPKLGYAKYIDVDCFVDYLILNEVVMNNDAGNLSTYPYKELNGKLQLAIWDFNNCYDNYQWFSQSFNESFISSNSWFDRLLCDDAFVTKVINRYKELRKDVLSEESLYQRITKYQEMLGPATERNFAVWGYSFDINMYSEKERKINNYEEAIAQLKNSIHKRFTFMDEHISDLYKCEK